MQHSRTIVPIERCFRVCFANRALASLAQGRGGAARTVSFVRTHIVGGPPHQAQHSFAIASQRRIWPHHTDLIVPRSRRDSERGIARRAGQALQHQVGSVAGRVRAYYRVAEVLRVGRQHDERDGRMVHRNEMAEARRGPGRTTWDQRKIAVTRMRTAPRLSVRCCSRGTQLWARI